MKIFKKISSFLKKDIDEIPSLTAIGRIISKILKVIAFPFGFLLAMLPVIPIMLLGLGFGLVIIFFYIMIAGILATPIVYLYKALPYDRMPHTLFWAIIAIAIILLLIVASIILPPTTTRRDSLSEDDEDYDPRQEGW